MIMYWAPKSIQPKKFQKFRNANPTYFFIRGCRSLVIIDPLDPFLSPYRFVFLAAGPKLYEMLDTAYPSGQRPLEMLETFCRNISSLLI